MTPVFCLSYSFRTWLVLNVVLSWWLRVEAKNPFIIHHVQGIDVSAFHILNPFILKHLCGVTTITAPVVHVRKQLSHVHLRLASDKCSPKPFITVCHTSRVAPTLPVGGQRLWFLISLIFFILLNFTWC